MLQTAPTSLSPSPSPRVLYQDFRSRSDGEQLNDPNHLFVDQSLAGSSKIRTDSDL